MDDDGDDNKVFVKSQNKSIMWLIATSLQPRATFV